MEPAARDDVHNEPVPRNLEGDPRVPLALERTFLAWIRTALAMMGFGFVVARFGLFLREVESMRGTAVPRGPGISPIMGTSLVALGVFVAAYAAIRFQRGLTAVAMGEPPVRRAAPVPMFIAFALCAIGSIAVWYFLTVR